MITKLQAETQSVFYHIRQRYSSRGVLGRAYQCRANGKLKTWKRSPEKFSLPIKIGFKEYSYIDNDTAHLWLALDPTDHEGLCEKMEVGHDTPPLALADRLIDRGYEDVAAVYLEEMKLRNGKAQLEFLQKVVSILNGWATTL